MGKGQICVLGILALSVPLARGADLSVTYSDGGTREANVLFSASTFDLTVTLTNTSLSDVTDPSEILTGVFYDVGGSLLNLTRTSAFLGLGSTVFFGGSTGSPSAGQVGGEWEYLEGVGNAPFSQKYAISSAGLGLTSSNADLFPGDNLYGPTQVDGLQYGITSAVDDSTTGNSAVTGPDPLIKNRVVFTLSGLPEGFNPLTDISQVQFQYGTALCTSGGVDPCIPAAPEPATLSLLAFGGMLLGWKRRVFAAG